QVSNQELDECFSQTGGGDISGIGKALGRDLHLFDRLFGIIENGEEGGPVVAGQVESGVQSKRLIVEHPCASRIAALAQYRAQGVPETRSFGGSADDAAQQLDRIAVSVLIAKNG